MSAFQFDAETQALTIKFLDKNIGSGTQTTATSTLAITGSYNWPPDSIAEVAMSFYLELTSDNTCVVEVDWPGLLPEKIEKQPASYWMWLLLARPVFNITTAGGDLIVVKFTGPPQQPEIITGLQVSVSLNGAQHATALTFVYDQV